MAQSITAAVASFMQANPFVRTKTDFFKQAPVPENAKKGEYRELFAAEALRQQALRNQRQQRQRPPLPVATQVLTGLEAGLSMAFGRMFSFRTASMGNHFRVSYYRGRAPQVRVSKSLNWDGYSRSCSWQAVEYTFTLHLPYGYTVSDIEGVMTVHKGRREPNRNVPTQVYWFKQGRGMELTTVAGWLWKGFHAEGDEATALKRIKKARKSAVAGRLETRTKRHFTALKKALEKTTFVSVEDSRRAGNCLPGIEAFARRHGIDLTQVGAIRADYLLELAGNDNLARVKNSIDTAVSRIARLRTV